MRNVGIKRCELSRKIVKFSTKYYQAEFTKLQNALHRMARYPQNVIYLLTRKKRKPHNYSDKEFYKDKI